MDMKGIFVPDCPLGLEVCYPSCYWWHGNCTFEEAKVKPEECPKLDGCPKIKVVRDKDLLDFQCAEAIKAVCAKCEQDNGDAR